MPRYEIVAHVIRELDCDSAEEAAALFRGRLLAETCPTDALVHLAVWRDSPEPDSSPIPASLRLKLVDFFASLQHCAEEAEKALRVQIEEILMASATEQAEADKAR
jgi:hypothetical protein